MTKVRPSASFRDAITRIAAHQRDKARAAAEMVKAVKALLKSLIALAPIQPEKEVVR